MPLITKPPHIRQLEAAVADLASADFMENTGVPGIHVRHRRNRLPTSSELPCVTLRWLGCDQTSPDGDYVTAWEQQMLNHMQLEVDLELDTEESGIDPTGWGKHSMVAAYAYSVLAEQSSALFQLCDHVRVPAPQLDEDSKPDDGRLVLPFDVVYRVRTDDPNVLLAPGENAT
jgi:hypothetical protein